MKIWQLMNLGYNESMRYLLPLTLLLMPLAGHTCPAEEPPDDTIPILESARELFGARANFAANRLDSFFATERADDEFGRSRIRVRSRFNLRERAKSELDTQYRFNLRLPHLEEKFKYEYYQSEDEKKEVLTPEEKQKLKENRLFEGWLFNADVGVSAAIPPKLITRARVRKNFDTGQLIHRFSEQLTHITDETGLVEETELDSDYGFSESVLFRFVNYKRWQISEKDFNTNHGPTLLHRVTENDAFNYGLTMQSIIHEGIWFVNNYQLAVNYRRNLYKQWIYLDIVPGLDFPKVWSFRRTPFINFQIEILFGS